MGRENRRGEMAMEKIKLKNKFKNLDDLLLSYDKNTKIFSDLVVLKVGSF